ncbi:MAG: Zn-ribbon domain-containing OB-fold protein [Ramlibacter sp.]
MNDTTATRKIPAPLMNPEAQPWFDAAGDGRLLYRHCNACNLPHHPPRSVCPHCHSDCTDWKSSGGLGSVYSASTLRRGVPMPYCIAYVTLDEGVTMLTNLVGFGEATPPVGTRVQVRFAEAEGGALLPVFGPIASAG